MTQKSRRAPRSIVDILGEAPSSPQPLSELGRAMYAAAHSETAVGIRRKSPFGRKVAEVTGTSTEGGQDESLQDTKKS